MASKKSIGEWESMFKRADKDNNGFLDICELRDLLKRGKCNITDSQIADAFIFFDTERGDKKISLPEFIKGLTLLQDFITKLTALFRKFDADNSGWLDRNELRAILCSCGQKFTDAEVADILRQADKNGDNKICFDEFLDACT